MGRYTTANWVAALSVLLALVGLLFLALWPYAYEGEVVSLEPRTQDGESVGVGTREARKTSASLIEENGAGVLAVLTLPVMLTGLGLVATFRRSRAGKALVWIGGGLLLLFAWASMLSIGPFYVPAALSLLVAALLHTRSSGAAASSSLDRRLDASKSS